MRITKLMLCLLSVVAVSQMARSAETETSSLMTKNQNVAPTQNTAQLKRMDLNHSHEHGNEIYTDTLFENKWMQDRHGQGEFSSSLTSWIGTDENKLFIEANVSKADNEKYQGDLAALYSRNIATFWDAQAGVRYRQDKNKAFDQRAVDAVVGIQGLAPYFFETDAYLYVGQHQYVAMELKMTRDVLFTQKLIAQPYLSATIVAQDESKSANQTGLSDAEIGIQTRYEMNRRVMPFIDVAYRYEKGLKDTAWQHKTESESGMYYGAGILLRF